MGNPTQELGVIVCCHIAREMLPILELRRSKPIDSQDSGWQAYCNAKNDEQIDGAEIWSVGQILEYEPSLVGLLDLDVGTILTRETRGQAWSVASCE